LPTARAVRNVLDMAHTKVDDAHRRTVTTAVRARAMQVAALAGCDARTALKALLCGVETIRVMRVREALETALRKLDDTGATDAAQ
jgi:hypothetical protein